MRFLGFLNDVARLLSHVDVVWQAEAGEGQSDAILEGMSAGVPVVAADSPGNRELVTTGETGYLVSLRERAGFGAARYRCWRTWIWRLDWERKADGVWNRITGSMPWWQRMRNCTKRFVGDRGHRPRLQSLETPGTGSAAES